MSVVAARIYDDHIAVAADSIMVNGYSKTASLRFTKLERINDMIVGCCGTAEEGALMWHYMRTHRPDKADEKSILDFFVEFKEWRTKFTFADATNDYLMAFDGKLFYIGGDLLVTEVKEYYAIGAGEDFANTALYLGCSPREAVKVACEMSCFVSEPIKEELMLT